MAEIYEIKKQHHFEKVKYSFTRWVQPGDVFLHNNRPLRVDANRVDERYQFVIVGYFRGNKIDRILPTEFGFADLTSYNGHMVRIRAVEWQGGKTVRVQRVLLEFVDVNHFISATLH